MRVEQEQRVTEDARVSAEQDAAAQRYVVNVLQVLSPLHFVTFGILLQFIFSGKYLSMSGLGMHQK